MKLKTKLKVSEREVLKSCLEYLKYIRGYFWRSNSGALVTENRYIRFGLKGSADIIGIRPVAQGIGQFIAIECKSTGAKQSDAQSIFQHEIEKYGGLYVLCYSLQDLIDAGLT